MAERSSMAGSRDSIQEFPAGVKTDWTSSGFWLQLSGTHVHLPAGALGKCVNLEFSIHGQPLRLPTIAVPNETALDQTVRFRCNLPVQNFNPLLVHAVVWVDKDVKVFATVVTLEAVLEFYGRQVVLRLEDGVGREVVEIVCFMQLVANARVAEELAATSRSASMTGAVPGRGSFPADDFGKHFTPSPMRPVRAPADFSRAVAGGQQGTIDVPAAESRGGHALTCILPSSFLKLVGCFVLMSLLNK